MNPYPDWRLCNHMQKLDIYTISRWYRFLNFFLLPPDPFHWHSHTFTDFSAFQVPLIQRTVDGPQWNGKVFGDRIDRVLMSPYFRWRIFSSDLSFFTKWTGNYSGFTWRTRKKSKFGLFVIPVKTGIQYLQYVTWILDSRLRGNDDFLRGHHLCITKRKLQHKSNVPKTRLQ